MYIGSFTSGNTNLYISGAIRHLTEASGDSVIMINNGTTDLAGNFYQDAQTNIFGINAATSLTLSTGIFRFVNNHGSNAKRYISTSSSDSLTCTSFDRGSYYIAFPNVILDSNDSLVIPARMGIDVISLHRGTTNTQGNVVLRSDRINGYDYDASFRVTGSGTSASLVDAGSVVVEREVGLYRGSSSLFPFASPFYNTQISGYFAGNWVRHPLVDGSYDNVTYVYGNKDTNPSDGYIDADQYIKYPNQVLIPTSAYLIKPRPSGFDYSTLIATNGLNYTGSDASAYDKDKYIFNGKVYSTTPYSEQLFAEDNLTSKTVAGIPTSTVNWLIGNSYTCPISTKQLAQKLQSCSGLTFSPTLYVYSTGSQSYQPMTISNSGSDIVVSNYTEIPSMSIFLIRLSKNTVQNGTLTLDKSILRHGKYSHGTPDAVKSEMNQSISGVTNQINFRLSPIDNDKVYDLAAIGLRENAVAGKDNYDVDKAYNPDQNNFQLYTLSANNAKLSANGVPLNTECVTLAVRPTDTSATYKLTASNMETLSSEGVWLVDKTTKDTINLKDQPSYTFLVNSNDSANRFNVYFIKPTINKPIKDTNTAIYGYFSNDNLIINNLSESDLKSVIKLYDMYGRVVKIISVTNYPQISIPNKYASGVYAACIVGTRYLSIKIVKKE